MRGSRVDWVAPSPFRPCGPPSLSHEGRGKQGNLIKVALNGVQDAFQVRVHLVVPEAHNAKTACFQNLSANRVVFTRRLFSVLGAVQFDNQPGFKTHEIHNVTSNGPLTAKLDVQETISQGTPQQAFFRGLFLTQRPCFLRPLRHPARAHNENYGAVSPLPLWERGGRPVGPEGVRGRPDSRNRQKVASYV